MFQNGTCRSPPMRAAWRGRSAHIRWANFAESIGIMFQRSPGLYAPRFPGRSVDLSERGQCMRGAPFLDAVWDRDVGRVEQMLCNADVATLRAVDAWGNGALHAASYRGSEPVVALLLGAGASPSVPNLDGWTALHFACSRSHVTVVRQLLAGVDTSLASIPDNDGSSPFHIAAENNCKEIVHLFIALGVQVDVAAPSGNTPLMLACRDGHVEVALALASAGGDICKRSTLHNGMVHETPLVLAEQQGWGERLRLAGAAPEQPKPPMITGKTDEETTVRWIAPAGRSAPVEGYRLQVRRIDRQDPEAPWVTAADGVRETTHTFYTCRAHCASYKRAARSEDLEPSEVYTVRVIARSIVGWSTPSEPSKVFVTAPAAPCQPDPPIAVNVTDKSITVRWIMPESNGAAVDKSELQWRLSHSPYAQWSVVPDPLLMPEVDSDVDSDPDEVASSDSDDDVGVHDIGKPAEFQYTVSDLFPGHCYRFRVRVHNLAGWSFVSEPSDLVQTESEEDTGESGGACKEEKLVAGVAPHSRARFHAMQRLRSDGRRVVELGKFCAESLEHNSISSSPREPTFPYRKLIPNDSQGRGALQNSNKAEESAELPSSSRHFYAAAGRSEPLPALRTTMHRDHAQRAEALERANERRARRLERNARRERRQMKRTLRRLRRESLAKKEGENVLVPIAGDQALATKE